MDRSVVKLAECHQLIGREARRLIRTARTQEWSLKPNDAIHLATVRRVSVAELQTSDARLGKYAEDAGIPILRPYVSQPMLPSLNPAPASPSGSADLEPE